VASWDQDEEDETDPCPYCGEQVYEDAEWCPSCGKYLSEEDTSPRKPLWVVAVALVLLALFIWVSIGR